MMKTPIANMRGQRGLALIAVLWLSVLLALISTAANRVSRSDVASARNIQANLTARHAVDSAIDVAIFTYATGPLEAWHADGTPYAWLIDDIEVRVTLRDEKLRTDLNTADEDALKEMLGRLGVPEAEAEIYAAEIIAHRDNARSALPGQATGEQLRIAGHFAFGLVDEIGSVTSMPAQTVDRVARVATVYSGLTKPVSGSQRGSSGQRADENIVITERPQPLTDLRAPPEEKSRTLRVQAEARTPDGAYFAKEVILKPIGEDSTRPYVILMQRRSANRLFAARN